MRNRWPLLGVLGALGCGVFGGSDGANEEQPAPTPAATEQPAPLPPDAPPPVTGTPKEDELTEKFGVFVSLRGTPEGDGTREKPLSSIAKAIEMAKASAKRVYVCQGTYKEALVLANAVSVIGGYECTTKWAATDGGRSRVESPTIPALRANDIVNDTSFIGFDVVTPDASGDTSSSIGLIARNAKQLTLAKGSITAGKGVDGAPGSEPSPLTNDPTSVNGYVGATGGSWVTPISSNIFNITGIAAGGSGGSNACQGHTAEAGGTGGDGGRYACAAHFYLGPGGQSIPDGWRLVLDTAPGKAGVLSGQAGQAGTDGSSASSIGALSADGYVIADGTAGSDGAPGKGGSGGAGEPSSELAGKRTCPQEQAGTTKRTSGNGGPGGGAGGCPGLAGTAGHGGGASVAALLSASEGLTFDAFGLFGGSGGAGGKGTLGSAPTAGGAPAAPNTGTSSAAPGGRGGRPGISGSGAGGPSFGIAHTGGAPKLVNGAKANAGAGGASVPAESKTFQDATWTLAASAPGLAEDVHTF